MAIAVRVRFFVVLAALLLGVAVCGFVRAGVPADTVDQSRQVRGFFVRGMTHAALEEYDEAISSFERALDLAPGEPALLVALADAQAAQGNHASALYYAKQALRRTPEWPYYHHRVAELQWESGRLADAATSYQTLLSRFPNDARAQLALAQVQADMDQPGKALQGIRSLIDTAASAPPDAYLEFLRLRQSVGSQEHLDDTLHTLVEQHSDALYRHLLAQLRAQQDRDQRAIRLFEGLYEENPSDPQVRSQLRLLYQEAGNIDAALALSPPSDEQGSPRELERRAKAVLQSDTAPDSADLQRARRLLERVLENAPGRVAALDLLGLVHMKSGASSQAASVYGRALEENPREPHRWRRAVDASLAAGRTAEAAQRADEGLLLFPGDYTLLRTAGMARLRNGEPKRAEHRFEEALGQAEEASLSSEVRAALLAQLGRARSRLGDVQAAETAYRKALDANPDQPVALNQYATILAEEERDLDVALTLAQRLVDRDSTNASYLDTLGWVHFKRGSLQEATTLLQKAIDADPHTASPFEHFGDVQAVLGNEAVAQTYWKRALERTPDRKTDRSALIEKIDGV